MVIGDMYYPIWSILFIGSVSAQKCIPLTGDSPATNPYHKYLIGYDLGPVVGSGNPIYITDPFRARQDFDMSFSIEKTVSTETSIQISSSVNTQKVSISEISESDSTTETESTNIMKSLENTFSKLTQGGKSKDNSVTFAKSFSESSTTQIRDARRKEISDSLTATYNENTKECIVSGNSATVDAEVAVRSFIVESKVSTSITTSTSKEDCIEHGTSRAAEQRLSQMEEQEKSRSHTNGKETSVSNDQRFTVNELTGVTTENKDIDNKTKNNGMERGHVQNKRDERQNHKGSSHTVTYDKRTRHETTIRQTISNYPVFKGSCYVAVCEPKVKSVIVPWMCKKPNSVYEIISTHTMFPDTHPNSIDPKKDGPLSCTTSIMDCNEADKQRFIVSDRIYHSRHDYNSLYYGDVLEPEEWLCGYQQTGEGIVIDESFCLTLKYDGNLVITQKELVIWETGIHYLGGYRHELTIDKNGHLIHRAQNIIVGSKKDDWNIVWSSVPERYSGVIVGIPDYPIGYVLIIDKGILYLYDSQGIRIWCGNSNDCINGNGFVHPQNYIYPHKFNSVVQNNEKYTDPRNYLDPSYKKAPQRTNNIVMDSGEFIESSDGKFKLVLDFSGNLALKQDQLTIWETKTHDASFTKIKVTSPKDKGVTDTITKIKAIGPYSLRFSKRNELCIIDLNHYIVWKTQSLARNVDVKIRTDGHFVIESSAYPLIRPTVWDHTVDRNKVERLVSPYVMDMSYTTLAGKDEREYISSLAGISFKDNKEHKTMAAARKCILLYEDYERLHLDSEGEADLVWNLLKCSCHITAEKFNIKPWVDNALSGNALNEWKNKRCDCIVAQNTYGLHPTKDNKINFPKGVSHVASNWKKDDCWKIVSSIDYALL